MIVLLLLYPGVDLSEPPLCPCMSRRDSASVAIDVGARSPALPSATSHVHAHRDCEINNKGWLRIVRLRCTLSNNNCGSRSNLLRRSTAGPPPLLHLVLPLEPLERSFPCSSISLDAPRIVSLRPFISRTYFLSAPPRHHRPARPHDSTRSLPLPPHLSLSFRISIPLSRTRKIMSSYAYFPNPPSTPPRTTVPLCSQPRKRACPPSSPTTPRRQRPLFSYSSSPSDAYTPSAPLLPSAPIFPCASTTPVRQSSLVASSPMRRSPGMTNLNRFTAEAFAEEELQATRNVKPSYCMTPSSSTSSSLSNPGRLELIDGRWTLDSRTIVHPSHFLAPFPSSCEPLSSPELPESPCTSSGDNSSDDDGDSHMEWESEDEDDPFSLDDHGSRSSSPSPSLARRWAQSTPSPRIQGSPFTTTPPPSPTPSSIARRRLDKLRLVSGSPRLSTTFEEEGVESGGSWEHGQSTAMGLGLTV